MKHYIEEKSVEFKEQIEKDSLDKKFTPEITPQLLKKKLNDLQLNNDNTEYLERYINMQNKRQREKERLRKKYDYSKNKVVSKEDLTEEELKQLDPERTIFRFTSSFIDQYHSGRKKIS